MTDDRARARSEWEREYLKHVSTEQDVRNRSGLAIDPLYDAGAEGPKSPGYPGQYPYTRGIYPSMYRGRTWTQRQLVGLGTPDDYNRRLRQLLASGATALSILPCNSVFRGYDMDEVYPELLGTCGVVVNTADHLARCFEGVDLRTTSVGLNDPNPFTLLAFHLSNARKQGVPWSSLTGTSNQSDFISHFVANHMFYRLDLDGARKVLLDQIDYCLRNVPNWNPLSVVGQHMQQAGATPAQAMGFTISTALQYAEDLKARGLAVDDFLPRFTFFFDISISFFEEVAKFRAGRRIWARLTKERLGSEDPRSWRFKFHGQTSGSDLTVQQPLNNIARVAIQAAAGIFSGLQSMHTDSYDEAISCPTDAGAQIAVNTQNILRFEAGLTDVIDPLGGSYYVERLTDQMEDEIMAHISEIDALGGMLAAVRSGHVQRRIDESALAFQAMVESGEQVIVGVNRFAESEPTFAAAALAKPDVSTMSRHIEEFQAFKEVRSDADVRAALEMIARSAHSSENTFALLVDAADVGVTHGEMVAILREELGFGMPLVTI